MSSLAALFVRDIRLAVRVGGGAGIGVLFFLIVVVLTPFASGPTSRCSAGSARPSSGSGRCCQSC